MDSSELGDKRRITKLHAKITKAVTEKDRDLAKRGTSERFAENMSAKRQKSVKYTVK